MLIAWMNCLAVGLADLHAHRIKHKDIKPSNILLAPASIEGLEVHPVFWDFGLAKQFSQRSRTACQCGTVFCQAPEQLAGQLAGRKADVFSLGCVLLELALLVASKKRGWLTKRMGRTGFASSAVGVHHRWGVLTAPTKRQGLVDRHEGLAATHAERGPVATTTCRGGGTHRLQPV